MAPKSRRAGWTTRSDRSEWVGGRRDGAAQEAASRGAAAHEGRTVHEYGHIFGRYYWWVWGWNWDPYLEARGLLGDSRLDSSYVWDVDEIFAEDYRQLLASPEAWAQSPYQMNSEISLASEVPGLKDFLCTTWVGEETGDWWYRCATP